MWGVIWLIPLEDFNSWPHVLFQFYNMELKTYSNSKKRIEYEGPVFPMERWNRVNWYLISIVGFDFFDQCIELKTIGKRQNCVSITWQFKPFVLSQYERRSLSQQRAGCSLNYGQTDPWKTGVRAKRETIGNSSVSDFFIWVREKGAMNYDVYSPVCTARFDALSYL